MHATLTIMALILGIMFAELPSSITELGVVPAKGVTTLAKWPKLSWEFPSRTNLAHVFQLSTALMLAVAANRVLRLSNVGL